VNLAIGAIRQRKARYFREKLDGRWAIRIKLTRLHITNEQGILSADDASAWVGTVSCASMSLHPEIAALVAQLTDFPPLSSATPEQNRERNRAIVAFGQDKETVESVEDRLIPGREGSINVRVYTPAAAPRAIIIYLHGGGWVIGDLETADLGARLLANRTECILVSVHYRLAPEFPFPAGLEDCYAALVWAAEHRDWLGAANAPLIVAGESAGGNLAASVAILARDRSGPPVALQILIYPATDCVLEGGSYAEQANSGLLTADDMRWFWNHYVADPLRRSDPLASPLRQKSLEGVAPALVQTAFYDPLRDEGRAYVLRLKEDGVNVSHTEYAELSHGYFNVVGFIACGRPPIEDIGKFVRERFEPQG
jgi:acetyl esterase